MLKHTKRKALLKKYLTYYTKLEHKLQKNI